MNQSEIKDTFSRFSASDPVPTALRAILNQRLVAATDDVCNPALSERAAGHAAGRISEITDLQGQINDLLKEPAE